MDRESVINLSKMNKHFGTAPDLDDPAFDHFFVQELIMQMHTQDQHGVWDRKTDAELIAPYIVTKARRRDMPIIGDPDARTLFRIEMFYNAVGMAIEKRCGVMAMPMMKMHHEGFGRLVLIAGRLVLVSRIMRDAHRFGFETLGKLALEGENLVDVGVNMIKAFPDVARYEN